MLGSLLVGFGKPKPKLKLSLKMCWQYGQPPGHLFILPIYSVVFHGCPGYVSWPPHKYCSKYTTQWKWLEYFRDLLKKLLHKNVCFNVYYIILERLWEDAPWLLERAPWLLESAPWLLEGVQSGPFTFRGRPLIYRGCLFGGVSEYVLGILQGFFRGHNYFDAMPCDSPELFCRSY